MLLLTTQSASLMVVMSVRMQRSSESAARKLAAACGRDCCPPSTEGGSGFLATSANDDSTSADWRRTSGCLVGARPLSRCATTSVVSYVNRAYAIAGLRKKMADVRYSCASMSTMMMLSSSSDICSSPVVRERLRGVTACCCGARLALVDATAAARSC